MRNKAQYTFTLNKKKMDWFKKHSNLEGQSMSAMIDSYISKLYEANVNVDKIKQFTYDFKRVN
jgi:hypothetical protein